MRKLSFEEMENVKGGFPAIDICGVFNAMYYMAYESEDFPSQMVAFAAIQSIGCAF